MASPYDEVSEPADEIIEAGFDPLIFWDEHKQVILAVIGIVLLAGIGFGWYEISSSRHIASAEAALAAASTAGDYQKVVDQYAGTVAAGNASLYLADKLRQDKKYDEATQALNTFLSKYPSHPLVHAGMLSLGETLEAQGKMDEALNEYQQVPVRYPNSYSAPIATLAVANIQKSQGKTEDARRTYESFLSQFPDSIFTPQATSEMRLLRAPEPAASPGAAPAASAPAASPAVAVPGMALPASTPHAP